MGGRQLETQPFCQRSHPFLSKAACTTIVLLLCFQVKVFLANSEDYLVQLLSPSDADGCVCSNEQKTYVWKIISKNIGKLLHILLAVHPGMDTSLFMHC